MSETPPQNYHHQKPPFYRDAVVVKWLFQLGALALVVFSLWFLASQARDNLAARDISTGFDFLSVDPGINLSEGIDTRPATGGRALWVGMVNTIRLATAGILAATILGRVVGLARLSNNWVVNKLGSVFVETLRNIPLLVQIILYGAILANLGDLSYDSGWDNWVIWSNKGLSIPRVFIADGFYQWAIFMLIGSIVARWAYKSRQRQHDETGRDTYPWLGSLGVLGVFAVIGWFIHPIFGWVGGIFGAVEDGISKIPEEALQAVISIIAVLLAGNWIRNFLRSRRTPGGSAQLTDDDKFRVIFSGISAGLVIVVVYVVWPGLSSWIINSSSDLFGVLEDKFGNGRSGGPFGADRPEVIKPGKFEKYGPSGLTMSIGFAAVFFGVVFYTAAFIAEIVRGGILAVPKGQIEAANSLGMKRSAALRTVILPQALRVMMPPLGNQYLNLTKNTSLAIAVGFSDLVQVGQTVGNQTGKNLSVFAIWMLFYLACSLTISVVVNFFNVRLRIVER
ncbi:MAG: ABC transporter permease subunit [Actinomycetota bacterium]|nr:ABC transporter permease subunit [Actinomycetota bacterium]